MKPVRPTRPQLISGRARFAFAALALSLLAACTDGPAEPTVEATPVFGPDLALVDGSTGGNPDFWWLPPTIPLWNHPYAHPDFEPDRFDPDLRPFVDICEDLGRDHVCDGAATSIEADVQLWLGAYSASYPTSRSDRDKIFLATARVDDIELGHVHVVVGLRNYQEGDALVIAGLPAIFRFSIEEDALCIENDPDFQQGTQTCTSETLGPEGGEVVLEVDGEPTLSVQIPATGTPTTITISNQCVDPWPLALPELSDCFNIQESAGIDFEDDPALVCFLPGGNHGGDDTDDLPYHDELTLYQFTSTTAEALPRVACTETEEVAALGTGGPLGSLARLARAVGSFIGPEPLHAAARRRLHNGGGGSVTTFKSDFVFSVPLAIERLGFEQGQDAPTGATLEASVLVYYFEAVEGGKVGYDGTAGFPLDITFTVLDGDGTVSVAVVPVGSDGIATTSWTLGSEPGLNRLEAVAGDDGDGFGNSHSGNGGPFYSDESPTPVVFGEGSVVFEANGVEADEGSFIVMGDVNVWTNGHYVPDNDRLTLNLATNGVRERVLWYRGHDSWLDPISFPNTAFSEVQGDLAEAGLTNDVVLEGASGDLEISDDVAVAFILLPQASFDADLAELRRYITAGGRVVLVGENSNNTFDQTNQRIQEIITGLGSLATYVDGCFTGPASDIATSPLTLGVTSVVFACASTIGNLDEDETALVAAAGTGLIAELRLGPPPILVASVATSTASAVAGSAPSEVGVDLTTTLLEN